MKVLIACLTYGNRPLDIIRSNIDRAGYDLHAIEIDREGIANALNDAIDFFKDGDFDALGFLANDIEEPDKWLALKVAALTGLHSAGVVATTVQGIETVSRNQHIIGNWLMSKEVIDKVGYFCESMFPYGPIDLDYCERVWMAGLCTYYVTGVAAKHDHAHASGNEYGYDKAEMVQKYWPQYLTNITGYRSLTLDYKKQNR